MVRKLMFLLVVIPGVFLGGLVGLAFVSVSYEPLVINQAFSKGAYHRAEQWLGHIRWDFEQDQLNRITLEPADINDLASYAASRLKVGNKKLATLEGIKTDFSAEQATVQVTFKVAELESIYLNFSFSFSEQEQYPQWDYMRLGGGYWPGSVLSWTFQNILLPLLPEKKANVWQVVTGAVEAFSIIPGKMSLVYRSDEALREQLKSQAQALMNSSPEEREVLQLYLDVLSAAAAQQAGTRLMLSKLFSTLFGLARARSEEGSAIEENSRLLRALAIQVADEQSRILLAPGIKPVPLDRPIVLRGRADLTQHFLVSAALALALDEETALHIGVSKEYADSEAGGSGFSLSDLVADMAGIRFASIATSDESTARKLQELMLTKQGEQVFMPQVSWLPPGMSASAYDDLTRHPSYPAMLDKIIKRLDSLPVNSDI